MYELFCKAHVTGYVYDYLVPVELCFPKHSFVNGLIGNVFSLTYFGGLFDEGFFGTHGLKILMQSMHVFIHAKTIVCMRMDYSN